MVTPAPGRTPWIAETSGELGTVWFCSWSRNPEPKPPPGNCCVWFCRSPSDPMPPPALGQVMSPAPGKPVTPKPPGSVLPPVRLVSWPDQSGSCCGAAIIAVDGSTEWFVCDFRECRRKIALLIVTLNYQRQQKRNAENGLKLLHCIEKWT